jgi:hypothetical protein
MSKEGVAAVLRRLTQADIELDPTRCGSKWDDVVLKKERFEDEEIQAKSWQTREGEG